MKVRRVDFSPDEWIAGTIDLSLAERGMYITACSLIYSRGGEILTGILRSFCHEDLRTYTRCLQKLLDLGKLELKEGYLSNKRCLSELQSAANRSTTAAENVAKRWSKSKQNNEVADTAVLPRGNANHQPSTINHQLKKDNSAQRAEFAAWYAAYPRKAAPGKAEKAYYQARREASAADLLSGIERYRTGKPTYADWQMPAPWLNGKRWLDEYGDTASPVLRRVPTAPPPIFEVIDGDQCSVDQSIPEPGTLQFPQKTAAG